MLRFRRKVNGFTLIELLMTVAIVGILIAVAAPSLRALIMKNRVQSAASEFQSALALARAEAIKRGGDTRIAVVANALSGTTADWTTGLTVFYDTTTNANGNAPSADDTTLLMKTGAAPADVLAASNFPNHIIYNGLGRSMNATGAMLAGYAAFGSASSDWICTIVSASGRTRTVTVSNAAYNATGGGCPTN